MLQIRLKKVDGKDYDPFIQGHVYFSIVYVDLWIENETRTLKFQRSQPVAYDKRVKVDTEFFEKMVRHQVMDDVCKQFLWVDEATAIENYKKIVADIREHELQKIMTDDTKITMVRGYEHR